MLLFLELFLYLVIVIIDSLILYFLQCFNPYYGMNAAEDAIKVVDILNELQSLDKDKYSYDEYLKFVIESLSIVHYCAWNIILKG